ncbi:MAG: hypothetical protein IJF17_03645 [Thermoguttaceae bacterium]|nr:hypothetical protein [Thermoguttaceae bacterium]
MISSYPVYVIRINSGYATMETPDCPQDKPNYAILVFTTEKLAEDFIEAVGIEDAEVRFLRNERELGRVIAIQPAQVTHIAIDSILSDGHLETNCLTLYDMIKTMTLARSPWDYPVFFLRQTNGQFAAIATENSLVIALFTTNQKAKDYRAKLERPSAYELLRVETPKQLHDFLKDLPEEIQAVAFNPMVDENQNHTAVQCMEIAKIIEKFLV